MKLFKEEFNTLLFLYKFLGLKGELYDMASFTYKLTTKKNMKATGILDLSHMTIEIDGESKSIRTLLSGYDQAAITLSVETKDEEELDEPVDVE